MPRKKQLYGGLPPRHVRRIKEYLNYFPEARYLLSKHDIVHPEYGLMRMHAAEEQAAIMAWVHLIVGSKHWAAEKLVVAGFDKYTITALEAGLKVLKRKRVAERLIWACAEAAFEKIGITADWTPDGPQQILCIRRPENQHSHRNVDLGDLDEHADLDNLDKDDLLDDADDPPRR